MIYQIKKYHHTCSFLIDYQMVSIYNFMFISLSFNRQNQTLSICWYKIVSYIFVETQIPENFTKAVNREVYQQISKDRKQSMLMIGIGVLAAVSLFIVLAIFYTHRLENVNKETDSNIYYSIK